MTRYLSGVLTIIAAGVLLIAYGLLSPRAAAFNTYDPAFVQGTGAFVEPAYAPRTVTYAPRPVAARAVPVRTVQAVEEAPVQERVVTRTVESKPRRDWARTAMVIGGSSAAGAGVGGIVGGKKGALIGMAIGGGASSLIEAARR